MAESKGVFPTLPSDFSFPQAEQDVLTLWKKIDAFPRSVERHEKSADTAYVFYDGPPFATGLPHYGHLVASTLKDVVPRYWSMKGKRVERRFGWDTHGLPIEMEMEKELGLSGPESIREFGVDKFNEACRANVLKYTDEWRETIGRLGRWVDFDNDYKTMDLSFMESVWWVFSQLWDKGLVYQGVRVMPYSWRLSTPLSNFEANLDYRDVDDPAVTVTMPIIGDKDGAALLVWTTTPWTLPSNLGVAVHPNVAYVRARAAAKERSKDGTETGIYVVAKNLVEKVLGKEAEILEELTGADLVGLKYTPLFDYFASHAASPEDGGQGAFVVMASDHVTTEDGTGLVHMAPAYGEDDFAACQKVGIAPVDPVDEEGRFTKEVSDFVGQNVKAADKEIIVRLKDDKRMFNHATIRHSYPFCWRSGTPLIYKTFPVWFVRVEGMRDEMQKNNDAVHWVPGNVGEGRFGNWLKDARDWAISRNRFWGTPLPLWKCESCEHVQCLASAQDLAEKSKSVVDDIHPHKIDDKKIPCDKCDGEASRVPEVFDCWFESGAMPFAQVHYPFENKDEFENGFPAEFIAEGLDQTRGWFYTLLILGTALKNSAPYKNVIVNGMVLATAYTDHDGKRYSLDDVDVRGGKAFRKSDGKELKVTREKMSKRLRNFPDPNVVLNQYGADALRAYLINSPVVRAEPLAFSEDGVRDVVRSVLLPLKNAWSFFTMYANIDGWNPATDLDKAPKLEDRPELDRWMMSVLQSLVDEVNTQMEGYYLYRVVGPILGFIDHLTNWYIRRSRRRFWRSSDDAEGREDKAAAYATLYEVLVTFAKVMAPVLPFISESIFQSLVVTPGCVTGECDSVHLCDYPVASAAQTDAALEDAMATTRAVVALGRAVREKHKLKTRQPLAVCTVVTLSESARKAILAHHDLIAEELNVKKVAVVEDDADLSVMSFKANFKTLGKRLGKRMKEGANAIAALTRDDWNRLAAGENLSIADIDISKDDVLVSREARGDVVLESEGELTVALDTNLDEALIQEGLMREVISRVQKLRKDGGFEITDRVQLLLASDDDALRQAIDVHQEAIAEEVLADGIAWGEVKSAAFDMDGRNLAIDLSRSI